MKNVTLGMFGRINGNGNVDVFWNDGDVVTYIDANIYPVDSQLSARYEHTDGIELHIEDAEKIGLYTEE